MRDEARDLPCPRAAVGALCVRHRKREASRRRQTEMYAAANKAEGRGSA